MRAFVVLSCLCFAGLLAAGCSENLSGPKEGFFVDDAGRLTLRCPPCTVNETLVEHSGNVSIHRVIFAGRQGDVYAIAALPPAPVAGFVVAPGAGVKKEGYLPLARQYAENGYAFLILDVRGNGGETPGYPLDLERDFEKFRAGAWPQYYLSVCDMSAARTFLQERYAIPVYAMGESNGGRYAAIAAETDPAFAGFIGISTSGFSRSGDAYSGDARRFLLSVDPVTQADLLSSRPSWIFHAPADPVIPFSYGRELFTALPEPKIFFPFNGTHGSNAAVHEMILGKCAQIYGTAG
ncbi:MAG: alpha/beta hydrolase [Methanolinea sp.]|nr:alpha/beta hydrolase [Methanolinea sp.]